MTSNFEPPVAGENGLPVGPPLAAPRRRNIWTSAPATAVYCLLAILVLGAILAPALATLISSANDPSAAAATYQQSHPDELFSHLRPATNSEVEEAQNAVGLDSPEAWQGVKLVFVANSSFYAAATDQPMIIIMGSPKVKWLGGQLGETMLVMRVTDADIQHLAPGDHTALDQARHYVGATTAYDPLCRAFSLGYATRDACTRPMARYYGTRLGVHLRTPTQAELNQQFAIGTASIAGIGGGGHQVLRWSTPSQDTTGLPLVPAGLRSHGHYVVSALLVQPGQKISGGLVTTRQIVLPIAITPDSYHPAELMVLQDRIARACRDASVYPYLGPEIRAAYHGYC